jgi:hypothetical protein
MDKQGGAMNPKHDPDDGRQDSGHDPAEEQRDSSSAQPPEQQAGAKAPPWQVPKPELRPELLHQPVPSKEGGPSKTGGPGQPSPIIDPFARDRERALASAAARRKRSQRRTAVVGLGVTALLAGTITAIVASNEEEADYAQVCFDDQTGQRVEDTQCSSTAGRSGGLYAWYFYPRGASVPPVGGNRSSFPSYTSTIPQGAKASTGYSTKGGTVSRGGFGSGSKGGSTGG